MINFILFLNNLNFINYIKINKKVSIHASAKEF